MVFLKDPRVCTGVLVAWGMVFTGIFLSLSNEEMKFKYGPESGREFLSIQIDTWFKWTLIASLFMVDKFINSISADIIGSWISHTVMDHKTEHVPYSKSVCIAIADTYSAYFNLRFILTLQLLTTQFDFGILRVVADVVATHYSAYLHLKEKKVQSNCDKKHN